MTLEKQVHELEVRVRKLEQYVKTLKEQEEIDKALRIQQDEDAADIGNDLN